MRKTPEKLLGKEFEQQLKKLDGELVKLQIWAQQEGARIIVVFEGRDAAGKGGVIKRITARVSPRVFRVVALSAPTERANSRSSTSSATCSIFRPPAKSSSSIAVGITAPELSV